DVADLVVIDPERLKSDISKDPIEIEDLRLGGAMRMVRRSGSIVSLVAIGGKIVFENGRFAPDFGKRRYGRLLHSTHRGNGGTR
ncbi:MAG: D-amino acid aminohydrolase, partial [Deltaproteobacteria bacterium]